MFNSDPAFVENHNIQLRLEVDRLKARLEDEEAKISKRDLANGKLLAAKCDLIDEVDDLNEQLAAALNAYNDKSLSNCDFALQLKTLGMEKTALEAQVGRLVNDASETWQEGLTKFIQNVIKDTVEDTEW